MITQCGLVRLRTLSKKPNKVHTAKFQAPDNFVDQLCRYIESESFGFCFRGSGWNHGADALAGIGIAKELPLEEAENEPFAFFHINYDHKNTLEKLSSQNEDHVCFPDSAAVLPKLILKVSDTTVEITCFDSDLEGQLNHIYASILKQPKRTSTSLQEPSSRLDFSSYTERLEALQEHFQQGDIYQANFCQEFYWENARISASEVFISGFESNPNPFAVYAKLGTHHCISFSPERFLKIESDLVTSQPMKGTAARFQDPEMDKKSRQALAASEKDRRENVMIVDMVRNDLSHYAVPGSVKVPELYKIVTYPKVHQMHSTIQARLRPATSKMGALKKAFPMGSMTGAPKIRAMQIIDNLEQTKRGLFSGSIGYHMGDKLDSNVLIRTLIYNRETDYLSCHVGGGITALSNIEAEYQECLIKAQPIFDLLGCEEHELLSVGE